MARNLDSTITLSDSCSTGEKHIVYQESLPNVWKLPEFLSRMETYLQVEDQDDEPAPVRTWLARLGNTTDVESTWLINLYLGKLTGSEVDANQNDTQKQDEIFIQTSVKLVATVPENICVLSSSILAVFIESKKICSQFSGIYETVVSSESPITFTGALDRSMLKRLKLEDSLQIVIEQSVYRDLLEWPISEKSKIIFQRLLKKPLELQDVSSEEKCAIQEIVKFSANNNLDDVLKALEHLHYY